MTKYLLLIILILATSLTVSIKSCQDIRMDRNRLSDNQRTLLADIGFYRTKDSLSVASVERLTLTNREFRKYAGELEKTVEKLNLKVKHLQSSSQSAIETEYLVKTEIRDSIIILPGRIDTLNCINYRDSYLTFSGSITGKQFSGLIQSRDTIIQLIHRVPRRFWFIRWGTKAIRQEVISRNPYSRITYTEYIELKK
ncbi:MAG: hypothetical protein OSJ36_04965 [Odoribacter sp.]|nr:hypothetical protein [Odoribacter sp.]